MLLLLLGCANEATVTDAVELEWHAETVPCVERAAEFDVPDGAVMLSYVGDYTTADDVTSRHWSTDVYAEEGYVSLPCDDDLTFVYAVAK